MHGFGVSAGDVIFMYTSVENYNNCNCRNIAVAAVANDMFYFIHQLYIWICTSAPTEAQTAEVWVLCDKYLACLEELMASVPLAVYFILHYLEEFSANLGCCVPLHGGVL